MLAAARGRQHRARLAGRAAPEILERRRLVPLRRSRRSARRARRRWRLPATRRPSTSTSATAASRPGRRRARSRVALSYHWCDAATRAPGRLRRRPHAAAARRRARRRRSGCARRSSAPAAAGALPPSPGDGARGIRPGSANRATRATTPTVDVVARPRRRRHARAGVAVAAPPPHARRPWSARRARCCGGRRCMAWREHPLLGLGPDNFRRAYNRYLGLRRPDERLHANNLYFETLASLGLAGIGGAGAARRRLRGRGARAPCGSTAPRRSRVCSPSARRRPRRLPRARLLRLLPGVHADLRACSGCWPASLAGLASDARAAPCEGARMTRDRSLETSVLLQDILVVLAAMLLSRVAHAALVGVVPDAEAAGRRRRVRAPAAGLPADLDLRRRAPGHSPPADADRREAGDRPARDPDAGVGRRRDRPDPDVRAGVAEPIADHRLPRAVDGDAAGGQGGAAALAGAPARAVARAADRRRVRRRWRASSSACAAGTSSAGPGNDPAALDARFRAGGDRRGGAGRPRCRPSGCSPTSASCAEAGVAGVRAACRWSRSRCRSRRRTSRPSATATTSSTSRASSRRGVLAAKAIVDRVLAARADRPVRADHAAGRAGGPDRRRQPGAVHPAPRRPLRPPVPDAEVPHHARRRRAGARGARRPATRWTGRCSRCATTRA